MLKSLKLSLLLLFLAPYSAFSQNSTDPALIKKLDNRRALLEYKIENEVNPEKRKSLIRSLYQTQEYYLNDNARMEMVRATHPEFAKQVEYYRELPAAVKEKRLDDSIKNQMSKSSEIIADPEVNWKNSNKNEQVKVCTDSTNLCLKEGKLNECKFVLLRCKFIIDEQLYKQVKAYVKTKANAAQ